MAFTFARDALHGERKLDAEPAARRIDARFDAPFFDYYGGMMELFLATLPFKVGYRATFPAAMATTDPGDLDGLLRNDYRGCRYAFGYPACPELEDRAKVVDLLGADRIGVELSEEYQLVPEQATDAIIVHHPEANYFNAK